MLKTKKYSSFSSLIQAVRDNKLTDRDLERLTKAAFIEHEIRKLNSYKHLTEQEAQTKVNLELNMLKYSGGGTISPYSIPLVGMTTGRRPSSLSGDEVLKRRKKRRFFY